MAIANLFSKQRRKERGEAPDVFVYDRIPNELRVQIVHIWRDALGRADVYNTPAHEVHKYVIDLLCREYGVFRLADGEIPEEVLARFLLREQNVDRVLDVIQFSFRAIQVYGADPYHKQAAATTMSPDHRPGPTLLRS